MALFLLIFCESNVCFCLVESKFRQITTCAADILLMGLLARVLSLLHIVIWYTHAHTQKEGILFIIWHLIVRHVFKLVVHGNITPTSSSFCSLSVWWRVMLTKWWVGEHYWQFIFMTIVFIWRIGFLTKFMLALILTNYWFDYMYGTMRCTTDVLKFLTPNWCT